MSKRDYIPSMILRVPSIFTVTGHCLDADHRLREKSVDANGPLDIFWTVYTQVAIEVRRVFGGGISSAIGVFLYPGELEIIRQRCDDPLWTDPLWPTDNSFPICNEYQPEADPRQQYNSKNAPAHVCCRR